jgi:hypothetical protein
MNRTEITKQMRTAAAQVLQAKGYISVVDVLLAMGRLSKENYERWRFRQVPHLEKVLPGSLNEHAFFGRELRTYARDELKLKPSHTAYVSWGKGGHHPLRFSKSGNPHLEELFSTHYVSRALREAKKARQAEAAAPVPAATPPIQPPHAKIVRKQEKTSKIPDLHRPPSQQQPRRRQRQP